MVSDCQNRYLVGVFSAIFTTFHENCALLRPLCPGLSSAPQTRHNFLSPARPVQCRHRGGGPAAGHGVAANQSCTMHSYHPPTLTWLQPRITLALHEFLSHISNIYLLSLFLLLLQDCGLALPQGRGVQTGGEVQPARRGDSGRRGRLQGWC